MRFLALRVQLGQLLQLQHLLALQLARLELWLGFLALRFGH
jgi:hypothetical protein